MSRLIDLDKVVGEDITVRLRGVDYRLPGDVPLETYFRLIAIQDMSTNLSEDDDDAATEFFDSLFDVLHELFAILQPDLDKGEFRKQIGIASAIYVTNQVVVLYADAEESEGSNGNRPTRRANASSKSSARKRSPKTSPS